jgi:hypothetical protein
VYDVIVEPPLLAGAVYATVAEVPDATVAVPIVGAPDMLANVREFLKKACKAPLMLVRFLR